MTLRILTVRVEDIVFTRMKYNRLNQAYKKALSNGQPDFFFWEDEVQLTIKYARLILDQLEEQFSKEV